MNDFPTTVSFYIYTTSDIKRRFYQDLPAESLLKHWRT